MEMTVNQAITIIKRDDSDMKHGYFCVNDFRAIETLVDCGKKYQLMQLEYDARLRADMVAMLTELQLECEENTVRWYVGRVDGKSDDVVLIETLNEIIHQKIDKLNVAKKQAREKAIKEELYKRACMYAISKLVDKGSQAFGTSIDVLNADGSIERKTATAEWSEVLDWLGGKYEKN